MEVIAEKYEVIRSLGEGASGTVYLVKHRDLGVQYALKLLNSGNLNHERFIERFRREAELLLKFSHPGVTQVRDFGRTSSGQYYMAMDFCDGVHLKDLLEQHGALTQADAVDIIAQLLDVLAAAHDLGIIHRDVKPENIMLEFGARGEKRVRVLDFGVAKLRETAEENEDVQRTLEGVTIGTPQYMSPEQAAGDADLDHRVDLYSTAVVLYELLEGRAPFLGATVVQTLILHLTRPPPAFTVEPPIDAALQEVVFKGLAKDRNARFQTAVEFRDALQKSLVSSQPKPVQAEEREPTIVVPSATGKKRILCLDDSEMILNILKLILESQGYQIIPANNCAILPRLIFEEGIKYLISDIEMPDMRGTKVCQMLKRSDPNLKVILFSNIPERDLEKSAKECGADGWISKNWKPEEWVNKVKEIIGEP